MAMFNRLRRQQPRQPEGVPDGGQWAQTGRSAADIPLDAPGLTNAYGEETTHRNGRPLRYLPGPDEATPEDVARIHAETAAHNAGATYFQPPPIWDAQQIKTFWDTVQIPDSEIIYATQNIFDSTTDPRDVVQMIRLIGMLRDANQLDEAYGDVHGAQRLYYQLVDLGTGQILLKNFRKHIIDAGFPLVAKYGLHAYKELDGSGLSPEPSLDELKNGYDERRLAAAGYFQAEDGLWYPPEDFYPEDQYARGGRGGRYRR